MQRRLKKKATIALLSLAVLVPAAGYAAAYGFTADVPVSVDVEYWVHETPTDPESDVTFKIKLSLTEGAVDGDSIGWEIDSIEFRDPGNPDTVWVDSSPSVPSADGLWWIDHADADEPQTEEFAEPPHLDGTGDAQDPNDDDLDYDFEGFTYTPPPPPAEPPYTVTASFNLYFARLALPPIVIEERERVWLELHPINYPGVPS